jgi:hypothetical protein
MWAWSVIPSDPDGTAFSVDALKPWRSVLPEDGARVDTAAIGLMAQEDLIRCKGLMADHTMALL